MSEVWDWFRAFAQTVVTLLTPGHWMVNAAELVASMLPLAADLSPFMGSVLSLSAYLAGYYNIMNQFMDMPVFASALGIMLASESSVAVFRMWRTIRSVVS